jgi:DNA repair protein RecO (recombination protein O)
MATYKTQAIILSSYPYREHDRIISMYSDSFGRIEARARGTRKITSKLAGNLEPCIETELLLANGRRWDILAGSRTSNYYQGIRKDFKRIAAASVCLEAVKVITRPLARDERIYTILKQALNMLEHEHHAHKPRAVVTAFLWQLLNISGFGGELANCIQCRTVVQEGSFSLEGGGVLCATCQNRDVRAVQLETEVLRELKDTKPFTRARAQDIATRFWQHVLDHTTLHSWELLEHA